MATEKQGAIECFDSGKLSLMSSRQKILQLLSDGQFHSGTQLGETLGITRAAVNKAVQGLVDKGLEIHSVPGKGYKWAGPGPLLDRQSILDLLGPSVDRHQLNLDVLDEIDSTSRHLLAGIAAANASPRICLAEAQTGGRGRRGRSWQSTPYQNLACSIAWRYNHGPAQLSGLSIAAGIALVRGLREFGIAEAMVKWPNDILCQGRKLAGILVDIKGEADGPTDVVLGFGLNVRIGSVDADNIDQSWIDLAGMSSSPIDRNQLAATLIRELVNTLSGFDETGLDPYLPEWETLHVYANQPVRLLQADREIHGTICGIDPSGALKLDTGVEILTVHSGEVSLRAG